MKKETTETNTEQLVLDTGATEAAEPAKKSKTVKFFTAGNMAVMGILSAIAYVLYLLPKLIPIFNLPFFPPWLDIQISDLPALLGGFAIGPWASVIIIVVKCALKMPLTSTSCVGELADIVVGIAFVLPASILYRKIKQRKGALLGMLIGTLSAVIISVLANWLVLVPFYAWHYGLSDANKGWSIILSAVSSIYEGVTRESFYKYYLFLGVIPFNLMRCVICSLITYFVYKPLSKALHWEIKGRKKSVEQAAEGATAATEAEQNTTSDETSER